MKNSESKTRGIVLLAIILLASASAGLLIYRQLRPVKQPVGAVISVNGVKACTVDLSEDAAPYEISLKERFGVDVVIEVKERKIHFKSSNCPDQICVHAGWLEKDMDTAVCMPNRVSVTVLPAGDLPQPADKTD